MSALLRPFSTVPAQAYPIVLTMFAAMGAGSYVAHTRVMDTKGHALSKSLFPWFPYVQNDHITNGLNHHYRK